MNRQNAVLFQGFMHGNCCATAAVIRVTGKFQAFRTPPAILTISRIAHAISLRMYGFGVADVSV